MDNKSNDYSEWDYDLLKDEFTALDDSEYDLENTGFDLRDIGNLLDDTPSEEVEKVDKLGFHQIECPRCHHKFQRKENGK